MSRRALSMIRRFARRLRLGVILPIPLAVKLYGGTDKSGHGYAHLYGAWLRGRRSRRFTMLEIGVFRGDSLRVWRDVFPRATIIGLDISPPDIDLGPRVRIAKGDQASTSDLIHALADVEPPSIVVDDGSHRGSDIWATFRHVFPLMPHGGVYIIEDLATSYWREFGGDLPAPDLTGVGLGRELIDAVQVNAPVHSWWGGPSRERPAPSTEFADVAALHVLPNALVVEKR